MSATEAGGEMPKDAEAVLYGPTPEFLAEMQVLFKEQHDDVTKAWRIDQEARGCCASVTSFGGYVFSMIGLARFIRRVCGRAADPRPAGEPRRTCDDNSDYPCQVHRRENQLQDERDEAISAKEKAEARVAELERWRLGLGEIAKRCHVDNKHGELYLLIKATICAQEYVLTGEALKELEQRQEQKAASGGRGDDGREALARHLRQTWSVKVHEPWEKSPAQDYWRGEAGLIIALLREAHDGAAGGEA